MQLNKTDAARWIKMADTIAIEQRNDPNFTLKTEFRMDDPAIKVWIQDVLAPSLLDGEVGVQYCLDSVEREQDTVVKALKIAFLEKWWGSFEAKTPEDVVVYLKKSGLEKKALQHTIVDTHFPPAPTPEYLEQIRLSVANAHGVDPDDLLITTYTGDVPTIH